MVSHQFPPVDFSAIKARQQTIWSTGDYSIIGTTLVGISEQLCEAADLHAGESVLDVATGSGITAIAAARRFCEVTGIDYVPALLEDGRQRAAAEHLHVTFQEGDTENIPFADASFDVVLSTTPTGFVGSLFRLIGKYLPPPSVLKPAASWGTEERLRDLFGNGIASLRTTKQDFIFRYRSASHWLDHFGTYYGPMVTTLKALDATRQEQFLSTWKT